MPLSNSKDWNLTLYIQTLFWTFFGVLNLVIEIALIILPIHIVTDVHIMHSAKSLVIAVFVIRLL